MQGDIGSLPRRRGVLAEEATERIKRRLRICVQEGIAQPGLAHFANGQVLSFVARVTETRFPVPRLQVIGKFSQLTPQADIEELVPVSKLFAPYAGIIDTAEPNPGGQGSRHSVNIQSHIPDCEGIKRIHDRHTDAVRATRPYRRKISSRNVEWIGCKWNGGQVRTVIRARIFKVAKYCQVLVAYVARERAVVHLTVRRGQRGRNRSEVIRRVIPIPGHQISKVI